MSEATTKKPGLHRSLGSSMFADMDLMMGFEPTPPVLPAYPFTAPIRAPFSKYFWMNG